MDYSKRAPQMIARLKDKDDPGLKQTVLYEHPKARLKFNKLMAFIHKKNISGTKKVAALYHFTDWYITELKLMDHAICAKGCAWCCAVDIDITEMEANYIATQHPSIKTKPMADVRGKIKQNQNSLKKNYCPLLDQETGCCTVYDSRPLTCRSFFAFDDVKYCQDSSVVHSIYQSTHDQILDSLGNFLLWEGSNGKMVDIRKAFEST